MFVYMNEVRVNGLFRGQPYQRLHSEMETVMYFHYLHTTSRSSKLELACWQQVEQHSRSHFKDGIQFDTRRRAGYFLSTWTAAIRRCSGTRVSLTAATQ